MSTGEHGDHREFEELAAGWALHALEPDAEARFLAHLPGCPDCQQTVRSFEETAAELAYALPEAASSVSSGSSVSSAPPSGLRTRVMAAAGVDRRVVPLQDRPVSRRVAAPPWLAVAAVVALLALAAATAVLAVRLHDATQTADRRQQVVRALVHGRLLATLRDDQNEAVATVVRRDGDLAVVATGLTANPVNRTTYVLWGLRSPTAPAMAVGTFDVLRAAPDVRPVASSGTGTDRLTAYAVSLEPGQAPPRAPSSVIAKGTVQS